MTQLEAICCMVEDLLDSEWVVNECNRQAEGEGQNFMMAFASFLTYGVGRLCVQIYAREDAEEVIGVVLQHLSQHDWLNVEKFLRIQKRVHARLKRMPRSRNFGVSLPFVHVVEAANSCGCEIEHNKDPRFISSTIATWKYLKEQIPKACGIELGAEGQTKDESEQGVPGQTVVHGQQQVPCPHHESVVEQLPIGGRMGDQDTDRAGYEKLTVHFTDEEREAIDRNLADYGSLAGANGNVLYVQEKFKEMMMAEGLREYVCDLMDKLGTGAYSSTEVNEFKEKAVKALLKAYGLHNLPIYLAQLAHVFESFGDEVQARKWYELFLNEHVRFVPDDADALFLKIKDIDMATAATAIRAYLDSGKLGSA